MTNAKTGKVALMVDSVNPELIGKCLIKFNYILLLVNELTRDLSPTYKSVSNRFFPKAVQIVDKYHSIASALESVQDLRTKYRQ